MLMEMLFLVAGCALLFYGGDWLVDGIAGLANRLRVSPIVVAFVVMGFGTSAPELFVAADAMMANKPDIAVGNIVGSNIANLLLVLALAGLIAPLTIDRDVLRIDGSAMLVGALLFWTTAYDESVSRMDALLLVMAMLTYLTLRWRSLELRDEVPDTSEKGLFPCLAKCGLALVALPVGAHVFIEAAVEIAGMLGASDAVIGLTVVAIGTSLPEMAACVAAALRQKSGVILGGILGSNVFNGSLVIGGAAFVAPVAVAQSFLDFWIPVMILATTASLFFLRTGFTLSRREASVMLASYAAIFAI